RVYPLRRVGEPEDIAAAVAFLASRDAAWITGHTLVVDGGITAVNSGFLHALSGPQEDCPDRDRPGGQPARAADRAPATRSTSAGCVRQLLNAARSAGTPPYTVGVRNASPPAATARSSAATRSALGSSRSVKHTTLSRTGASSRSPGMRSACSPSRRADATLPSTHSRCPARP